MLTISLLTKFQKADFPDKNVLTTSFFFLCQDIWVSGGFFFQKCLFLKRTICIMKTEVNSRLNTIATTVQRVYKIFKLWSHLCSFKWLRPTYYL